MASSKSRFQLYVIGIGLVLTVAMAVSCVYRSRQLDGAFRRLALVTARATVEQVIATRRWNAGMGGVYVPVEKGAVPNPYLEDPIRDLTSLEGIALTKVNPAYMTRLVAETLQKGHGVQIHLTSLRPLNPGNAPDGWETAALSSFENGATEASTVEARAGQQGTEEIFRYMSPLKTDQPCLGCHARQGYTLASNRGGVGVTFSFQPYVEVRREFQMQILLTHFLAFLIAASALLLLAFVVDSER